MSSGSARCRCRASSTRASTWRRSTVRLLVQSPRSRWPAQPRRSRKSGISAKLADLDHDADTIALHPGAAERYARIVADLRLKLDDLRPGPSSDALLTQVRQLIDKVVVTPPPKSKQPVDLTVHGLIAELLVVDGAPQYRGAMVAGTRNARPPVFRFAA